MAEYRGTILRNVGVAIFIFVIVIGGVFGVSQNLSGLPGNLGASSSTSNTASTGMGSATNSSGITIPYGIIAFVPLTITNSQSTPTPSPFQQEIEVNSATYARFEAANLQNIEFFTSDGQVVLSWLESGATNNSTNTVYWLKLGSGIAANASMTVYMGFTSMQNNLLNNGTTGESASLSKVFGEYDNGPSIFTYYSNFAGNSLPTTLKFTEQTNNECNVGNSTNPAIFANRTTTANYPETTTTIIATEPVAPNNTIGTYMVNDGVTIYGTGPPSGGCGGGGFFDTTLKYSPSIVEANLVSDVGPSSVNLESYYASVEWDTTTPGNYIGLAGGYAFTYRVCGCVNHWEIIEGNGKAQVGWVVTKQSSGVPPLGIYGLAWTSSGQQFGWQQYDLKLSSSNSTDPYLPSFAGFGFSNGEPAQYSATFSWFRIRAIPPNDIMPSVSFGNLQALFLSSSTTSRALSQNDSTIVVPNGIVAFVTIKILNNQQISTPSPFQQQLLVDSSRYSQYEAPNLQNVEFFTSGGLLVTSWLESGASNNSTHSVYWLLLKSGIPAKGSITVYMGFVSKQTNLLNNDTSGEAASLSKVYGEYDNAFSIFTYYSNFAGNSLPSTLRFTEQTNNECNGGYSSGFSNATITTNSSTSVGANYSTTIGRISSFVAPNNTQAVYSVNNGLFINATGSPTGGCGGGAFFDTTNKYSPSIVEADIVSQTGQSSVSSESYYPSVEWDTLLPSTYWGVDGGYAFDYRVCSCTNQWQIMEGNPNALAGWVATKAATGPSPTGVYSLGWSNSGVKFGWQQYGLELNSSDKTYPYQSAYAGFGYVNGQAQQYSAQFSWFRIRMFPPNGIMPATSFGSLEAVSYSG